MMMALANQNPEMHQLISADVSSDEYESSEDEMDLSDGEDENDVDFPIVNEHGWVSHATGVESLADHILSFGFWSRGSDIDRAFRTIDRKLFLPTQLHNQAYVDGPMRHGLYHHSGPHIYASALHELEIRSDDSFLNLGSGTGFLNNLVACLQHHPSAVNHGIEIHQEQVDFATLTTKQLFADAVHPPQHTTPTFFKGNAFNIDKRNRRYNKVYIGQECRDMQSLQRLLHLVESPGRVVVPIESYLFRVNKDEDGDITATPLSAVGFGEMVEPEDDDKLILLAQQIPKSLMALCRDTIRCEISPNQMTSVLPKLKVPIAMQKYLNYYKPLPLQTANAQRFVLNISSESPYFMSTPVALEHTGSVLLELTDTCGGGKHGRDLIEAIQHAKTQVKSDRGCLGQLTVDSITLTANSHQRCAVDGISFGIQMPVAIERDDRCVKYITHGTVYPTGTIMVRPAPSGGPYVSDVIITLADFCLTTAAQPNDDLVIVGHVVNGFEALRCAVKTISCMSRTVAPSPFHAMPLAHIQALGPIRYTEFLRRYGCLRGRRLCFVNDVHPVVGTHHQNTQWFLPEEHDGDDMLPHYPGELPHFQFTYEGLVLHADALTSLGIKLYNQLRLHDALNKFGKALRYISAANNIIRLNNTVHTDANIICATEAAIELNRGATLVKIVTQCLERGDGGTTAARCMTDGNAALTRALASNQLTPAQKAKALYRRAKVASSATDARRDLMDASALDHTGSLGLAIQTALQNVLESEQ